MADDTSIHDVKITQVPIFNQTGRATATTRVTFWIGQHGPFTQDFAQGQDSALQIQQGMEEKQRDIQALMARYPSTQS
jgi:hypothetical protein